MLGVWNTGEKSLNFFGSYNQMIPNIKYKTTLCKNWLDNKKCPKAGNCYFAHGQTDLRSIEQVRFTDFFYFNSQEMAYRHELLWNYHCYNGYKMKELENYKTVRCKFFSRGECKLGDNCTFAHNNEEIRLKVPYDEYLKLQGLIYYEQYGSDLQTNFLACPYFQPDQNSGAIDNLQQPEKPH